MQNVGENFFLLFFFTIFGFSDIDLGVGLAKGILSQSPVFYFLFEFEVDWTRLQTS